MSTATRSVEVNVPVSLAYNQWTQMESYPKFMTGVDSVEQLDDSHTVWHMTVAGIKREFPAEITEQIPDERIAWNSQGEFRQSGEVIFTALGPNTTEVELTLDWEPTGALEKIGSTLQVDDVMVASNLERFKNLVESQGATDGAWRGTIDGDSAPL